MLTHTLTAEAPKEGQQPTDNHPQTINHKIRRALWCDTACLLPVLYANTTNLTTGSRGTFTTTATGIICLPGLSKGPAAHVRAIRTQPHHTCDMSEPCDTHVTCRNHPLRKNRAAVRPTHTETSTIHKPLDQGAAWWTAWKTPKTQKECRAWQHPAA